MSLFWLCVCWCICLCVCVCCAGGAASEGALSAAQEAGGSGERPAAAAGGAGLHGAEGAGAQPAVCLTSDLWALELWQQWGGALLSTRQQCFYTTDHFIGVIFHRWWEKRQHLFISNWPQHWGSYRDRQTPVAGSSASGHVAGCLHSFYGQMLSCMFYLYCLERFLFTDKPVCCHICVSVQVFVPCETDTGKLFLAGSVMSECQKPHGVSSRLFLTHCGSSPLLLWNWNCLTPQLLVQLNSVSLSREQRRAQSQEQLLSLSNRLLTWSSCSVSSAGAPFCSSFSLICGEINSGLSLIINVF